MPIRMFCGHYTGQSGQPQKDPPSDGFSIEGIREKLHAGWKRAGSLEPKGTVPDAQPVGSGEAPQQRDMHPQ